MSYDEKCPVCGTVNHGVYLDETEGWMICEHCGRETQDPRFIRTGRLPVLSMKGAVKWSRSHDPEGSE